MGRAGVYYCLSMDGGSDISRNCRQFWERLAVVAGRCDRNPAEIGVIAVAKTKPLADVLAAVGAGMRQVGENKVQEAQAKYGGAQRDFSLHMIGHLQSNKAKAAVELFDAIQSVDSLKLAQAIDKEAERLGKVLPIMLEVNTSRETQKFGLPVAATSEVFGQARELKNVRVRGLMTIAPFVDEEAPVRGAFRELRELLERIKSEYPTATEFNELSMGMSDDWELAVAEGATMIRIGRALFGERN